MGTADRQPDAERGAGVLSAVGGDGAVVQSDEFLDQSQADSAALGGPCACGFDAMEAFKQPGNLRGGDTDPGVGDGKYGVGALALYTDGDGTVEGELQRVGKQVEHHLLPHLAVHVHRLIERRAIDDERQPGPVDRRAEDAGQFAGEGGEVDGLKFGLHSACLDAGEVQQGVDQFRQP